jgi:DNA repair protein RecO (recombination protein O)
VPVYKAEAIVLRQQMLGESDRIVTLFTREYGKLRTVARGVRRSTSRLAGRIEPFTQARMLLARGRTLDVIAQAEIVEPFPGIRSDLLRSACASYVVELVERGVPERDRHEDVFVLIIDALEDLERAREDDAEMAAVKFAVRLASLLGYQPETATCVECGRHLPHTLGPAGAWAFSPLSGGALCPACRPQDAEAVSVSPGVLAACDYLVRVPARRSDRLRIPPIQRSELAKMVQLHLEHRLEAKLRSPLVIRRLKEPHLSSSVPTA